MSATTKIYCPKCQAEIEVEEIEELVLCQGCGHEFVPVWDDPNAGGSATGHEEKIPHPVPSSPSSLRNPGPARTVTPGRKTRERAELFEGWSLLCAIVGFVFIFLGVAFMGVGQSNGGVLLSIAGALMGLAGWLYLVAQIIHIRANTEK